MPDRDARGLLETQLRALGASRNAADRGPRPHHRGDTAPDACLGATFRAALPAATIPRPAGATPFGRRPPHRRRHPRPDRARCGPRSGASSTSERSRPPTGHPTSLPQSRRRALDLGSRTTLAEARRRMPVVVPTAPASPKPDEVWFAGSGRSLSLVYRVANRVAVCRAHRRRAADPGVHRRRPPGREQAPHYQHECAAGNDRCGPRGVPCRAASTSCTTWIPPAPSSCRTAGSWAGPSSSRAGH